VRHPVIVLKCGGSVVQSESGLRVAVHEVYRWRRAGYRVVCVVSALAGETDRLLAEVRGISPEHAPEAAAAVVATGELRSAALLGLFLDRAGIPASVLAPSALRLVATGPPASATPVAVDRARLEAALASHGVVVVPGFVGEDGSGRAVLFGRGGSDLTALFLASVLAARCRLVKDVDGLYERDPSRPGPRPRRYAAANFEDLLATDGTIVQHEAARFARAHDVRFELGSWNAEHPTEIGRGRTRFEAGDPRRPLSVVVLGAGTVGGGLLELLRDLPGTLEVVGVCARRLDADPVRMAGSGADVVVELLGGCEPARGAVLAALAAGSDVVTANKRLLAVHGQELRALAGGRRLLASAAVGGAAPVLERIAAAPRGSIADVRGVLNGTMNFVLDRLARGSELDAAVAEARRRGYAERDAARDLAGHDAADKLAVIGQALGLGTLAVEIEAFGPDHVARCRDAVARGAVLRQVARIACDRGRTRACVGFEEIEAADPLHGIGDVRNAVVLRSFDGSEELVAGTGAGRWPTAEAVLADLLDLCRAQAEILEPSARQG
jgi:homoserine dehydrogenase